MKYWRLRAYLRPTFTRRIHSKGLETFLKETHGHVFTLYCSAEISSFASTLAVTLPDSPAKCSSLGFQTFHRIVGVVQQDATAHLGTSDRVGQYHHPLGEPSCQLIWMCVESRCASSVPRFAGHLAS